MSDSFEMISRITSIYQIQNPSVYFTLVDSIVTGKYSPDDFYRDFDYPKYLVREMIHEYTEISEKIEEHDQKEYQECCLCIDKLQIFLEYLNTEIPNTEREEFAPEST